VILIFFITRAHKCRLHDYCSTDVSYGPVFPHILKYFPQQIVVLQFEEADNLFAFSFISCFHIHYLLCFVQVMLHMKKCYRITGFEHNLTGCIMFVGITDIKGKYWSENFALGQGIRNHKSNKHAVVDYDAAVNSIFMDSFLLSFMS
jgi:hypothetical protein